MTAGTLVLSRIRRKGVVAARHSGLSHARRQVRSRLVARLSPLDEPRRKYWDRAFSGKALADYAPFVLETGDAFVAQVRKASTEGPIDLSKWCSFVAFEVMGLLGFGDNFGMLESGREHFYLSTIETAMKAVSTFAEIPWIMPVLTSLPAEKDIKQMEAFSMETTTARKNRGTGGRRDIFRYIANNIVTRV
jgi:cytochrome P450